MSISVEEFARHCQLTAEETDALRAILADKNVMAMAERIAENCFYPQVRGAAPDFPENSDLARAWFAACYLGAESAVMHYERRGYPLEVLYETMTDLGIWLRNTKRNYGVIGVAACARMWQTSIFSGSVIRFGKQLDVVFFSHAFCNGADNETADNHNGGNDQADDRLWSHSL